MRDAVPWRAVRFWLWVAAAVAVPVLVLAGWTEAAMVLGILMTSPGCCCDGAETCNEYTDSCGVDTDWSEEAGSWTFTSGSGGYVTVSDSDAQLIYQAVDSAVLAEVPYAFHGRVTRGGSDDYTRIRFLFDWVDTDDYWFGEATDQTIDNGGGSFSNILTLRVGNVVAGSETILEETEYTRTGGFPGSLTALVVCYENGIVTVTATQSGGGGGLAYIFTNFSPTADRLYGIGTGDQTGLDTATMSQFDLTILLDAEDHTCIDCNNPTLPACEDCDGAYAAAEYSLEVSGFSVGTCGDCDALNGTFTLTHDTDCTWRSAEIEDICGVTVQYRLDIDSGDGIRVSVEQVDPASGDLYSWLATTDDDGGAPWSCLRWTDLLLDEDAGDDIGCGPIPDTVSLTAVRPW